MMECRCDSRYQSVDLADLWVDLKRMLRVQIKELIYSIDDAELAEKQRGVPVLARKTDRPHVA